MKINVFWQNLWKPFGKPKKPIVNQKNAERVPNFPNPIPIVFGGGTSLVKGFLQVVGEQFNQDEFPIQISDIKLVEDAHTAVARGCLSEAELIEEEE